MSKELKVGDRVRCYIGGSMLVPVDVYIGTVMRIISDGTAEVQADGKSEAWLCHPKQCRRLKPKKERVRVWLKLTPFGPIMNGIIVAPNTPGAFEFIEVRRGK